MSLTSSITKGFAVCTPDGSVLGRTYRETADEALSVIVPQNEGGRQFWSEKQNAGWSVRPVVAFIDLTQEA
jgi:hypothetical protein